jgi:hypothetical protein
LFARDVCVRNRRIFPDLRKHSPERSGNASNAYPNLSFFIRYYFSISVVFVLWRRGRFKGFRPIKHNLGRAPVEKIEYIPEEDKVKYGRLISFVFLPKFLAAITLGWFLMARNHCP